MVGIRLCIFLFVLTGVLSCNKDDGPPPDPCAKTPPLAVTAKTEGFSLSASSTGGEAPYSFQLDNGDFQNSGSFTGLAAKEYTITVKDANDCTDTTKVTVIDPCADGTLAVQTTVDGNSIMATAEGGTEPYTFSIDGQEFKESGVFADLAPADYTITVKDANNCSSTATATIEDPCGDGSLFLEATVDVFSIIANASGGTAPYTYSIDGENFQESGAFADLSPAEYTVTVMDTNGCTFNKTVTVVDVCASLIVEATTDVYTITANATGGTAPYTYILTNNEGFTELESGIFESLDPGDYTLEVKDANNCSNTTQVTLADPCVTLSVEATAESFSITAIASGGTLPYMYSLDGINFQESSEFTNLSAQNYTVTIKDANECTATFNVLAEELSVYLDPRDDKSYRVVKIGNQIWLAENLNYQGGGIGFSCPNNDDANCATHGALYNWDEAQQAAPQGWHVPTIAEWDALLNTYGGSIVAGDDLKVGGGSGFDAQFSGYVQTPPDYPNVIDFNLRGFFWSEEFNQLNSRLYIIDGGQNITIDGGVEKINFRCSVRLVKD
ncbi:FISUMP domain-containing protein [Flagellimonas sp. GZD32]|uniref:FISUMP domain-containing protein n=1 Tax=Flagellimonas cixiensis TaxID=3228750 RepID=UPI0035C8F1BA